MPHIQKRKRGMGEDRERFDLPPSATKTKALSANKDKKTTNAKTKTLIDSRTHSLATTTSDKSDPEDHAKSAKKRKLSTATSTNPRTTSSLNDESKGDGKQKNANPSLKNKKTGSNLDLKSRKNQQRSGEFADDTPKQFARLLAWTQEGKKIRKGLDDGISSAKADKKQKQKQKQKTEKEKQQREDSGRKSRAGDEAFLATAGGDPASADTNASANDGDRNSDNDADSDDASSDRNTNTEDKDTSTRKTNRKTNSNSNSTSTAAMASTPDDNPPPFPLKIRPGEKLRDFSLRVDQSLPLTSIPKYGTKIKSDTAIAGLNGKAARLNLTKHNRRLLRLQEQWREEERKRRERLEGKKEEGEEKREEEEGLWVGVRGAGRLRRGGKDGKGSKKGSKREKGWDGAEDDPWRGLERKRREEAQMKTNTQVQGKEKEKDGTRVVGGEGGVAGLGGNRGVPGLTPGSSVQEPPRLMLDTRKLKRMFKVDGDSVK